MDFKPPRDEIELIQQIGAWAKANFTEHHPDLGVIEEIGEATHCVLKRIQKIRGFKDEAFFIDKFSDALADCIIYLAHWCYLNDSFFKFGRNQQELAKVSIDDEDRVIIFLLQTTAAMKNIHIVIGDKEVSTESSIFSNMAQRLCTALEYWAAIYKIDLRMAVATTWNKVSQRDWNKNPVTAGNEVPCGFKMGQTTCGYLESQHTDKFNHKYEAR